MLFSGTSDLLLQMVKPHLNSSNDFSTLAISFQRFSFLCTSSWLSSTIFSSLSSSLSSPLNAFELVLTHLTSVPPVHFLLSPVEVEDTVANFLVQASWIALPFDHGFQHSIVLSFSCHALSVNPTGLLTVTCGSHVQARLGRSIFPRARRAVTSRAAICQERAWAAEPHASLSPAAWKAKRTRQRKQHSCARHQNAARCVKYRQRSRALFFPAS